jgi:hypothetical protein
MIPEYKTKSNIGVGVGVLVLVPWFLTQVMPNSDGVMIVRAVSGIGGLILIVWGCMNYAAAKGYSKAYGLLIFMCFPGMIALALLKDKNTDKEAKK